ncbi:hypothetical protein [Candidatus Avelusimicrobium sp.]
MKKVITIMVLIFCIFGCKEQEISQGKISCDCEKILNNEQKSRNSMNRYVLYKTNNIYNFIKLDTQTGQVWQVQWSVKGENRGEIAISLEKKANTSKNGRFKLVPTENFYNFLLLDRLDGRVWQVQWHIEDDFRGILSIEE